MKTLTARGHSDDTFGVYGAGPDDDHDDCANFKVRCFLVRAAGQRVLVTGVYGKCPSGVWSVGLAPVEEGDRWPDWAQPRWHLDGYTPVMTMSVPDDVTVHLCCVDGETVKQQDPPSDDWIAKP